MVVKVHSLREYFRDSLHSALEHQQVSVGGETEQYVVNLLTLFAHSDALFEQTADGARIRHDVEEDGLGGHTGLSFEKAGPRELLFFDPAQVRAAIVTCARSACCAACSSARSRAVMSVAISICASRPSVHCR